MKRARTEKRQREILLILCQDEFATCVSSQDRCPWQIEQVHYDVWCYSLIFCFSERPFSFPLILKTCKGQTLFGEIFNHQHFWPLKMDPNWIYLHCSVCHFSILFYEVETIFFVFAASVSEQLLGQLQNASWKLSIALHSLKNNS